MDKRIYILGTRGIPASHGGFETFAEKLSLYLVQKGWQVTIYCQSDKETDEITEDDWHGIKRIHISPYTKRFNKLLKGPIGTGLFDWRALEHARSQAKGVFLTLGYNTGAFNIMPWVRRRRQMINMDGIEWQREKWSALYKLVFYINYRIAGKIGDILIADHPEIQRILEKNFNKRKIRMIPYGADPVYEADDGIPEHYKLTPHKYVTLIARPEPENNILPIVQTWSLKRRGIKLAVLGEYRLDHPYQRQVRMQASDEVVFLGPVYKPTIVQALRFYSLAYIHGHTVGGTNPSLVEALAAGNPVIARDNVFNRWTAGDAGIYFTDKKQLSYLLDFLFANEDQLRLLSNNARARHAKAFQWPLILGQYEAALEQLLNR